MQYIKVYYDRVWGQPSANIGGEASKVPGDGSVYAESGSGAWNLSGDDRQNIHLTDSEGRTIANTNANKIAGTSVVDDNGHPKAVYHFADNSEFQVFERGDIDFHFGTHEQAVNRSMVKDFEQGQMGDSCNSPSAIKLREVLDEKGYDGITYYG